MIDRYGNRRVPKMIEHVRKLESLIRAEGTPAIQDQWDEVVQFIDYFYQEKTK